MADEKKGPSQWAPVVMKKGKARAVTRIFIKRRGERIGYFPNIEAAQKECDRRNAIPAGQS